MSLFKGQRDEAIKAQESIKEELQSIARERDKVNEALVDAEKRHADLNEHDGAVSSELKQLKEMQDDLVSARREADRRREEAEDAMRGTQDRADQEVRSLLQRIESLENRLEEAIDAKVAAEEAAAQGRC